ncbi:MAG TPA: alpha/beta hydrolase [Candidatus Nanoarchaeia archaeon]|nr:alpha/beta hydrolase [Candidatus Nanoarchaeia archaeon]
MFVSSFDRTRIWYNIQKKSGCCLIFVHGWANNWTTWKKERSYLKNKGYSVCSLDLRGHGRSDKPNAKKAYTFHAFAKDIDAIVRKEKLNEIVLIGHSMGGLIALSYYKLFKKKRKIKALILCDTTYRNVFEHHKINVLSPFIRHVLDFIIAHNKINKKHFQHMKDVDLNKYKEASDYFVFYESLHNTPLKAVCACLEAMMKINLRNILSKIDVPVLIIEGEKDTLLSTLDIEEMFEEIKDVEIDFDPCGRHFVNLEDPKKVDRYIAHFLNGHNIYPNSLSTFRP